MKHFLIRHSTWDSTFTQIPVFGPELWAHLLWAHLHKLQFLGLKLEKIKLNNYYI